MRFTLLQYWSVMTSLIQRLSLQFLTSGGTFWGPDMSDVKLIINPFVLAEDLRIITGVPAVDPTEFIVNKEVLLARIIQWVALIQQLKHISRHYLEYSVSIFPNY